MLLYAVGVVFWGIMFSFERGIQQGDPLGPLLYSLVTLRTANKLKSSLKLMYLDDTTIGGSPLDVILGFQTILQSSAELGLELNLAKCEVFIFGGSLMEQQATETLFRDLNYDLKFPVGSDFILLGASVFTEAIVEVFNEKHTILQRFVSRLPLLNAHQSLPP